MRRRPLLRLLLAATFAATTARAQDALPRRKVSAAALYEALSARFPLRLGAPGLLELRVGAPRLLLLPARNKLGVTLLVETAGPGLRHAEPGELDLVFALRYESTDRSLRAREPEVLDLRLPGLSPDGARVFRRVLPRLAAEAMAEVVVHRFTAADLALPATLGFEPDTLTVLDDGLLVGFARKSPR
jgi:hypothetical protein